MEKRETIFNKYGGKCGYCGEVIEFKSMQVDHIIPKRDFWSVIMNQHRLPEFLNHLTIEDVNHIDNLMPSCRVCNKWKNTHSIDEFRYELEEQVKRLNLRSANYRIAKKFNQIQETITPIKFYFETY